MADQTQRPKPSSITWEINMFYHIWHIAPNSQDTLIISSPVYTYNESLRPGSEVLRYLCGRLSNHHVQLAWLYITDFTGLLHIDQLLLHVITISTALPISPSDHTAIASWATLGKPSQCVCCSWVAVSLRLGFFSRFHFVKVGKSHTSNMSQSHHKQEREYRANSGQIPCSYGSQGGKSLPSWLDLHHQLQLILPKRKRHAGAACWRFLWFFVPKNVVDLLFGALFGFVSSQQKQSAKMVHSKESVWTIPGGRARAQG